MTALMFACSKTESSCCPGSSLAVVRALLTRAGKLQIDAQCTDGRSALMFAAQGGLAELLQVLIEAGASLELVERSGRTAWQLSQEALMDAAHLEPRVRDDLEAGAQALAGAGARRPPPRRHTCEAATSTLCAVPMPQLVGPCSTGRFEAQFRSRMAVVLRGAASHWPACTTWTDYEALASALGGSGALSSCLTSADNRQFAPAERSGGPTSTAMQLPVSVVLGTTTFSPQPPEDGTALSPRSRPYPRRLYCKHALTPALGADVAEVGGLPRARSLPGETRVWISSEGSETPLHFDHCHSVIAQVVGCKRLVVFSPAEHPFLYPNQPSCGNPRTARVDVSAWREHAAERRRWPLVGNAFGYEAVLEPGDVAYIPPGKPASLQPTSTSRHRLHPSR
jgi:hypothetical protein